eukprot:845208-Rhodomonas_salina.6
MSIEVLLGTRVGIPTRVSGALYLSDVFASRIRIRASRESMSACAVINYSLFTSGQTPPVVVFCCDGWTHARTAVSGRLSATHSGCRAREQPDQFGQTCSAVLPVPVTASVCSLARVPEGPSVTACPPAIVLQLAGLSFQESPRDVRNSDANGTALKVGGSALRCCRVVPSPEIAACAQWSAPTSGSDAPQG